MKEEVSSSSDIRGRLTEELKRWTSNSEIQLSPEEKQNLQWLCEQLPSRLSLVTFEFPDFNGLTQVGNLLLDKRITPQFLAALKQAFDAGLRLAKIQEPEKLIFEDESSMQANFSSSFNFRFVEGKKKLSLHALGLAFDLTPLQNPAIINAISYPKGSIYNLQATGTITPEIANIFTSLGFEWGGNWTSLKDYMHFQYPPEKILSSLETSLTIAKEDHNTALGTELTKEIAYWTMILALRTKGLLAG